MNFKTMTTAAVAVLTLAGAACSRSGAGQLSVSAQAVTSAGSAAATETPGGSLDLGQGITVSSVQFVVKRIALHLPESASLDGGSDGGTDDGGTDDSGSLVATRSSASQGRSESEIEDESEDDEVKIGPFLVDLSGDALANQTLTEVFDSADVLTGTFREIKIVIAPVASLAADGSSVTITGAIDGEKEFTFTSSLHAAQKIESEVTISEDGEQNVTLTVDPSGWFKDSAGNRLDPTDPRNGSRIEDNIKRSIRGFCDRDRDGDDDSGERGHDRGSSRS